MLGTFSLPPQVSDPDMHHGTSVTLVPWCMPGSLASGFLWRQWWIRRSRHSRRMPNRQFYISGKRPMRQWFPSQKEATAGKPKYRKVSNISRTLVGNKIVDHSDVVGASPVGAAPTTSSFSTWHLAPSQSTKTAARQYENHLSVGIWCAVY